MIETSTRPLNLLTENSFVFNVDRLKTLNPHVKSVNLPGVDLAPIKSPTAVERLIDVSNDFQWSPIRAQFLVDEDLLNWFEIWDWMSSIGFPQSQEQFRQIIADKGGLIKGQFSEGTLIVNSAAQNPIVEVSFRNMMPVSLSGIDFTAASAGNVTAFVQFAYQDYSYRRVSKAHLS